MSCKFGAADISTYVERTEDEYKGEHNYYALPYMPGEVLDAVRVLWCHVLMPGNVWYRCPVHQSRLRTKRTNTVSGYCWRRV